MSAWRWPGWCCGRDRRHSQHGRDRTTLRYAVPPSTLYPGAFHDFVGVPYLPESRAALADAARVVASAG